MFLQLLTSPVLAIPETVALEAESASAGAPLVDAPSIAQEHALAISEVILGPIIIAPPSFSQLITIPSLGITSGTPFCGSPTLATFNDTYVPVAKRTMTISAYPSRIARVVRYSE